MIDDMRVYNRQLTDLESMALFNPRQAAELVTASTSDSPASNRPMVLDHYLASVDEDFRQLTAQLKEARNQYMSAADAVKEIMVMREIEQPKPAYILALGEYNQRRDEVARVCRMAVANSRKTRRPIGSVLPGG